MPGMADTARRCCCAAREGGLPKPRLASSSAMLLLSKFAEVGLVLGIEVATVLLVESKLATSLLSEVGELTVEELSESVKGELRPL